jgi:hypothetical protein
MASHADPPPPRHAWWRLSRAALWLAMAIAATALLTAAALVTAGG